MKKKTRDVDTWWPSLVRREAWGEPIKWITPTHMYSHHNLIERRFSYVYYILVLVLFLLLYWNPLALPRKISYAYYCGEPNFFRFFFSLFCRCVCLFSYSHMLFNAESNSWWPHHNKILLWNAFKIRRNFS